MVNACQLWSGIFSQNHNFLFISVEGSNQKMVRSNWLEAERLFLLIPFIVTLHYDYAPVFDKVKKSFFVKQFLDSAVYYKIVRRLMAPLHELNFAILLFFKFLIFSPILLVFIQVKFRWLNCRNECGWTNIVGTCVLIWIQ